MQDIFIVIALYAIKNIDGTTTIIYNDKSEKFISNEQVAKDYYDYLKQKDISPDYQVVMQKLLIESEIDIEKLLLEDAMGKLTPNERAVIEGKINQ